MQDDASRPDLGEIVEMDPRDRPVPLWTVEDFLSRIGEQVGVTSWRPVTQAMVDRFALATDDCNFVHVNPERTRREVGLRGTIAHGFLTLSLLSSMGYEAMPLVEGATLGLNYGIDKARFISPVPVGARVRGRLTLADAERKPGALIIAYDVVVEIEGAEVAQGGRPALIARWLTHATLAGAT